MTLELIRSIVLVAMFVGLAILIAKAIERPLEPVLKHKLVKTIAIDIDTEIERQNGWR